MSELRSLFIRLKVKKETLDRFFEDKLTRLPVDEQWLSWWDSREMYGKSELKEIPVYHSSEKNRDVVDALLRSPEAGCHEEWDADAGTWTFSSLLFSENYEDQLPMLGWFTSIAPYLGAGEQGELLLYDFFWGSDDVMAHIVLDGTQSAIKTTTSTFKIDKKMLTEADNTMQKVLGIMQSKFNGVD